MVSAHRPCWKGIATYWDLKPCYGLSGTIFPTFFPAPMLVFLGVGVGGFPDSENLSKALGAVETNFFINIKRFKYAYFDRMLQKAMKVDLRLSEGRFEMGKPQHA